MSGLLSSSRVVLVLLVLSTGVLVADDGDHTPHWSFVAPKRQTPALDVSAGVRSAIDLFVQARLETAGLQASPAADRRTLMRRLSLDLLGLLPAAERVDQFVEDPSPDAYERLVDEMLASQHFPERWGRHWLDLARYADSFGYERDDVRPNAWRYRDWVVRSINRNQPYDQFIIEQIAGDLLPDPTTEQLIATGLHRMNIKNNESGINKDDYQNRETVDRVKTTATSVLGLTFECAQCHDHKYDPISQAEFYQFYSFFNNVEAHDLEIEGTPEDQARYQAALEAYETKSEILKTRKTVLEEMKQHPALEPGQASLGNNSAAIAEKLRWLDVSDALRASLGMPVAELGNEERQDVAEFWAMLGVLEDETRKQVSQLSVQKRHLPQPYVMTLREKSDARPTSSSAATLDSRGRKSDLESPLCSMRWSHGARTPTGWTSRVGWSVPPILSPRASRSIIFGSTSLAPDSLRPSMTSAPRAKRHRIRRSSIGLRWSSSSLAGIGSTSSKRSSCPTLTASLRDCVRS